MYKNIAIAILIFIVIFFMKQCADIKNISDQHRNNLLLVDNEFTEYKDKEGKKSYRQEQTIVSQRKDIDRLTTEVEGLKKINAQIKATIITKVDTIKVPIDNPIFITQPETGDKYLKLPAGFKKIDNEWYGFTGSISKEGTVDMDSLWVINKPTITFGIEKFNIKTPFRKRDPMVVFQDENPYSSVRELSNIKLDKPLPKISIGLQGGYGVTTKGLGGYIGIGVNYNLISF